MSSYQWNVVFSLLLHSIKSAIVLSLSSESQIRVLSLDVTGTLLATREPVIQSYYNAALWARLPNPPSESEFKNGFKLAFKERCIESPCFGGVEGISGREWWRETVARVLHHTGRPQDSYYTPEEFDRYFRRVYQHFGSPRGYMVLDDAQFLLASIKKDNFDNDGGNGVLMGITSNTPTRHMESVLPMLDSLHDHFSWFVCSQNVGYEKPAAEIFQASYDEAKFWLPDLKKEEILHIGDSYTCDYCGAKAFGFQAILLDRSNNPSVTAYQDWLEAPDYLGKSLEDVQENTITSLREVLPLLSLQ
jgi:REG-2-like HAD superfamily hydrolase